MSDYVDEMVEAFVEALLWAGLDWDNKDEADNPRPFDENYDADDIDPDALAEIRRDCERFYEDHACILDWLHRFGRPVRELREIHDIYSAAQCGHDFYLTREHHGAGFWDRGLGVLGDILTHDCAPYGSVEAYIGDDGKIHV